MNADPFQEKIVRLENALAAANAQIQALQEELYAHTGSWKLELIREDAGDAHWEIPSNGTFEWEDGGITLRLRRI